MSETIVDCVGLSKTFDMRSFEINALCNIDFQVKPGEFIGLIGPSGSGKTTLLNTISGLTTATSGSVKIVGKEVTKMNSKEIRDFRLKNIGLVFQEHLLIDSLTALENVEMPLIFLGVPEAERKERALKLLKDFGLEDKKDHLPEEMSGGQQQRIGIARSLITEPKLILADEPTGNIDAKSGNDIMNIFKEISKTKNTSVIMVSHNPQHKSKFDRVLQMQDGQISE